MDQIQRKRKTTNKYHVTKLKHRYWTKLFDGVIEILQSININNDIVTIKYVADEHKSRISETNFLDTHDLFPTPNLSFELYERLISLIANNVMTQTKNELKDTMYFSITIDSLPDTDQSAIYVRYVDNNGIPKKRFLDITNKKGDDALQLMNILHETLDKYDLNHCGFMGLSYNIDSNIPAYRASLRSCVKSINGFAEIVPCSSDSLSLVVIKAASSCCEGNAFFTLIDELFKFFLFFKYQWDDIEFLLKNMPYRKFSSKNKMYRRLNKNWSMMVYALFHVSESMSFPRKMCINAYILLKKVRRLETCLLTMFWEEIIGQITELEENLLKHVSAEVNFLEVFLIYESLISYLNDFRTNDKFMDYKTRALKKSNILHFNNRNHSEKPQMRFTIDNIDEDEKFKIKTYFYMIDEIQTELEYRKEIYRDLSIKFDFLNSISTITDADLYNELEKLQSIFIDISYHISTECNELKSILNRTKTELASIRDIASFISQQPFKNFFDELQKIIKMAMCISATNCQVEHSSRSILNNVITSLKSITNKNTYNSLIHINMNQECLQNLNFSSVIQDFAKSQSSES